MVKPKHLRNPKPKSARPKLSAIDQILAGARVDEDPKARAAYQAILGIAGVPFDLALTDQALMPKISTTARRALQRHLLDNGLEWGAQVTRVGVVAGSDVEVDVPSIRKLSSYYSRAGVDAITMLVPSPVPLAWHPCGFGQALDVHAVFFGPNVRTAMQKVELKTRSRRTDLPVRDPIQWYAADDDDALKATMSKMFRPPLTKVVDLAGFDQGQPVEGWDSREARQRRGLFTLMTRSMLPLKKAMTLIGEGRSVMAGAIAAAEVSVRKGRREGEPPVHPDGMPHFWFGELRRLDLNDFAVPLIKLR